jgi:hypothetical protein
MIQMSGPSTIQSITSLYFGRLKLRGSKALSSEHITPPQTLQQKQNIKQQGNIKSVNITES